MLRLAEEILLLTLDDDHGDVASSLQPRTLETILAGAVLMDLALENRIDTDLEKLMLSDSTPTGDELLDPVLSDIAKEPDSRTVGYWLERTARGGEDIRERALARLVERGILRSDDEASFFLSSRVSHSRRYPVVDGTATEEVTFRIMRLLFSDDIPDLRDIVIVSLAAACNVFGRILSREELAEAQPRIDLISKMDLIGQSVARAVAEQGMATRPPVSSARPVEEIPRVAGWPIIGSALDLASDLRSFLTRSYQELGPIFQFRALNRRYIALVGPEANRFIQKRGRIYLRSYETWRAFTGEMGAKDTLIGMDGAAHVRLRKVYREAFSRAFIESRLDEAAAIIRGVIADWPLDRPLVAHYEMRKLIDEQIALLTAGVSARDYADDLITMLDGLMKVHVAKRKPRWTLRLPRQARARRRVEELRGLVLAHHADEGRERRDLIDDLIELHESEPDFFPEMDFYLGVLGPFLVGSETAASVATFTLYSLLRHPDLLERVRAEADALFSQETLSPRSLRDLDVTPRVVLETLRMYPIVPGLTRTVTNSFEFSGYAVPARAEVILGITVPHNLPEHFPEPDRFDIERYAPERAEHLQPGVFAPFGLGTHRCLGGSFAETQIALTMLAIVHDLEVRFHRPGYQLKVKNTPLPHAGPSFKLRVSRRPQTAARNMP